LVIEMGRAAAVRAKGKGIADAKRAKLYARFGKQIVAAVKEGGPSENANSKLAAVLQLAKLNSVPRDLIERNIKKASDKSQADFQELTYEAYGLSGVGMVRSRPLRCPASTNTPLHR
jgi:transcriptional/translational regulatory protein YebC/TACO1